MPVILEAFKTSENLMFPLGGVGDVFCKPTHPNVSVALYRTAEFTVQDYPSVSHPEKKY